MSSSAEQATRDSQQFGIPELIPLRVLREESVVGAPRLNLIIPGISKQSRSSGGVTTALRFLELPSLGKALHLYKLWNRMSSGSYLPPPVKRVLIDKRDGGKRPLGIPTVSDRIAQALVKGYLNLSWRSTFIQTHTGIGLESLHWMPWAWRVSDAGATGWALHLDIRA